MHQKFTLCLEEKTVNQRIKIFMMYFLILFFLWNPTLPPFLSSICFHCSHIRYSLSEIQNLYELWTTIRLAQYIKLDHYYITERKHCQFFIVILASALVKLKASSIHKLYLPSFGEQAVPLCVFCMLAIMTIYLATKKHKKENTAKRISDELQHGFRDGLTSLTQTHLVMLPSNLHEQITTHHHCTLIPST